MLSFDACFPHLMTLLWFSVASFDVGFADVSPYVCTDYFSLVYVAVAEWPPFGKELLTRLTACSLYIMYFFKFTYSVPVLVLMTGFGF